MLLSESRYLRKLLQIQEERYKPSPGIEEVLDSLRSVGIEAAPGESVDCVIAEKPDGKRYKLPRDFNLFTNPVMIPIEEK